MPVNPPRETSATEKVRTVVNAQGRSYAPLLAVSLALVAGYLTTTTLVIVAIVLAVVAGLLAAQLRLK